MSYAKEVEIVLVVKVEAEATLEKVTAEAIGKTVEAVAANEVGEAMEAVLGEGSCLQVRVNRIPTNGDRPWKEVTQGVEAARAAIAKVHSSIRQD